MWRGPRGGQEGGAWGQEGAVGPLQAEEGGVRVGGHPQRGPSLPWNGQLSSRVTGQRSGCGGLCGSPGGLRVRHKGGG